MPQAPPIFVYNPWDHMRANRSRSAPWIAPVLAVLIAGAWLSAFPSEPRVDWADVGTEFSYLAAAAVAYPFIRRLGTAPLKIGWLAFAASLLLELLDEFTIEGKLWGTYSTGSLGALGLALAGVGFRRSAREREQAEQDRRLAEEATRRAKDAAEAANRELQKAIRQKEDLVSIVAHDFRSPITLVRGYAEALEGRVEDSQAKEMLRIIESQAAHLSALVTDTLTLSRLEGEDLPSHAAVVAIATIARAAVEAWSACAGVDVGLGELDETAAARVDFVRLRQVVDNLVANGVAYATASPRVRVGVRRTPEGVEVAVSDNGIGIVPEDLPRLFQRFSRLESGRRRQAHGTGLGLYICRCIVEAYGGRIWVESVPGQGSTFRFVLPPAPDPRQEAL